MRHPYFSVFLGHVPKDASEQDLKQLFASSGVIKECYIHKAYSEQNWTYGFVRFAKIEEAIKAVQNVCGWHLKDQTLTVELSKETRYHLQQISPDLTEKKILPSVNPNLKTVSKKYNSQCDIDKIINCNRIKDLCCLLNFESVDCKDVIYVKTLTSIEAEKCSRKVPAADVKLSESACSSVSVHKNSYTKNLCPYASKLFQKKYFEVSTKLHNLVLEASSQTKSEPVQTPPSSSKKPCSKTCQSPCPCEFAQSSCKKANSSSPKLRFRSPTKATKTLAKSSQSPKRRFRSPSKLTKTSAKSPQSPKPRSRSPTKATTTSAKSPQIFQSATKARASIISKRSLKPKTVSELMDAHKNIKNCDEDIMKSKKGGWNRSPAECPHRPDQFDKTNGTQGSDLKLPTCPDYDLQTSNVSSRVNSSLLFQLKNHHSSPSCSESGTFIKKRDSREYYLSDSGVEFMPTDSRSSIGSASLSNDFDPVDDWWVEEKQTDRKRRKPQSEWTSELFFKILAND